MDKVRIQAFAKINLTLDITGRREDGYHLLRSVMQQIYLCDMVDLKKAEDISLKLFSNGEPGSGQIGRAHV